VCLGPPQPAIVLATLSGLRLGAFTATLLAVVVLAQRLEVPVAVVVSGHDVVDLSGVLTADLAGVRTYMLTLMLITVQDPATDPIPVLRKSAATR